MKYADEYGYEICKPHAATLKKAYLRTKYIKMPGYTTKIVYYTPIAFEVSDNYLFKTTLNSKYDRI